MVQAGRPDLYLLQLSSESLHTGDYWTASDKRLNINTSAILSCYHRV